MSIEQTLIDVLVQMDDDQDDAAFYCDGGGSHLVAIVSTDDRAIEVRCDGEMRVNDLRSGAVYRTVDDLVANGYRTDQALAEGENKGDIEFENNPWFSFYDHASGEHLEDIRHGLQESIEAAAALAIGVDLTY